MYKETYSYLKRIVLRSWLLLVVISEGTVSSCLWGKPVSIRLHPVQTGCRSVSAVSPRESCHATQHMAPTARGTLAWTKSTNTGIGSLCTCAHIHSWPMWMRVLLNRVSSMRDRQAAPASSARDGGVSMVTAEPDAGTQESTKNRLGAIISVFSS